MRELNEQITLPQIEFFHPRSAMGTLSGPSRKAANDNRPGRISAHQCTTDPRAIAEAEKLAIEAMYLGADILEMLRRINAKMSAELSEETANLARRLMFWGVGAGSVAREAGSDGEA